MKSSKERILTTHVGSLPRPPDLLQLIQAREQGNGAGAPAGFPDRVRSAVRESVRRQAELGIDVVADGEMGRTSFVGYAHERLGGVEPTGERAVAGVWMGSREAQEFPDFYRQAAEERVATVPSSPRMACTGPLTYRGQEQLAADIANLRGALEGLDVAEAFIPAISPVDLETGLQNRYYPDQEAFLFALADAMHDEYRGIVDAGFVLQVDDPRLVTYYAFQPQLSIEECRKWAALRVEVINHALRDIPREMVRFHTCYSINVGPRIYDMELRDIVDIMLRIRAGAFSFEAANPRHDHEWRVWKDAGLPDDVLLIPGVITQSSVLVEHPQLVADRLERFASVVGRERVIAGADCGFASVAGSPEIPPAVAWRKLESLVEGARIATRSLWGSS